jgi:hypothetical protein
VLPTVEHKEQWSPGSSVAQAATFVFSIPRFALDHMASTGSRAFGTSTKAALKWVGATKADILTQNPGERGKQALKAIEKIEVAAEQKASRCSISWNGVANVK